MFHAVGQDLERDHLDFSYRRTETWTPVGPTVNIPSLWLSIGDPVSGPAIQFGAMPPPPGDGAIWLDTHYHGSDQFRALLSGQFLLQGRQMQQGEFVYQDSGVAYREGVIGGGEDMWMFAVHGYRPGAPGTVVRRDATWPIEESQIADDQLDKYIASPDDPYWQDKPGGAKGVKAVATTLDTRRGAYVWGSFGDTGQWRAFGDGVTATGAVIGDRLTGPLILTLQGEANSVLIPAATHGAEVIFVVMGGDVLVGDCAYTRGEIRLQKAGSPMAAVRAGPEGASVVFLASDRRQRPQPSTDDPSSRAWKVTYDNLFDDLARQVN